MCYQGRCGRELCSTALKALLSAPPDTKIGRRDRLILILLYDSAVRIFELLSMNVSSVKLEADIPYLRIYGKGDKEKSLLRNSIVTPSLAASIMNAKFTNGLPIYRICQEFQRNAIHISRQVMANWMIQLADRYLGIVYDRLQEQLLGYHVLQADETPVKVSKDGRPANFNSYMWVYRTGKYYKDTLIILYDYQKTRSAEHPERFLKGVEGLVVTDAHSSCGKLDREIEELSFSVCWAHARRRFAEALKAHPKAKRENASETIVSQALTRIAASYHLDNELSELSPEKCCEKRKLMIQPLVEAYFS